MLELVDLGERLAEGERLAAARRGLTTSPTTATTAKPSSRMTASTSAKP